MNTSDFTEAQLRLSTLSDSRLELFRVDELDGEDALDAVDTRFWKRQVSEPVPSTTLLLGTTHPSSIPRTTLARGTAFAALTERIPLVDKVDSRNAPNVSDICEPEWEPDVELFQMQRQVTIEDFDTDPPPTLRQVTEQWWPTWDEVMPDLERDQSRKVSNLGDSGINCANQSVAAEIQRNSSALLQFMRDQKLQKSKKGKKESLIDMAAKQQGVQSMSHLHETDQQQMRQAIPQQKLSKAPNFCTYCGGTLRQGFKFCVFCGVAAAQSCY
jgi:hypothetical protein